MAKTIRKNLIIENLYRIKENIDQVTKALEENNMEQVRQANKDAHKNTRYLINLLDQTTNIQ